MHHKAVQAEKKGLETIIIAIIIISPFEVAFKKSVVVTLS